MASGVEVDYTDFAPFDMPWEDRRKLRIGDIFFNQIKCLKCGWYIRSKNLHDYRTCKCGAVSIDGGSWYSKISGAPKDYRSHILLYDDIPDQAAEDKNELVAIDA